jgi:hypothetical protein
MPGWSNSFWSLAHPRVVIGDWKHDYSHHLQPQTAHAEERRTNASPARVKAAETRWRRHNLAKAARAQPKSGIDYGA